MEKLKIFIADDQTLMREGLQIIINLEEDMEVIGTASNGQETLEQVRKLPPDIVLMDVKMPIMDGIECTKRLKKEFPHMIILILTTFPDEKFIIEGLGSGANGFFIKGINYENLITSIRKAAQGQLMIPAEVASKLAAKLHEYYNINSFETKLQQLKDMNIHLTDREYDIIKLLSEGLSNRLIANRLYLSEGTVKNYISEIYQKLNVKNRQEALQYIKNL
ncbi:response regulator transcription factor [Bacillus sp. Marseille-P3661]|uniref:response regulator transcription factor n=1 Tax=Bacillus sp. Marseille-P3661 TaxID=1936234 RepID=UPI000C83E52F|nr:response regulator transcription factor [Bacillus sp. Marseille-P3661]